MDREMVYVVETISACGEELPGYDLWTRVELVPVILPSHDVRYVFHLVRSGGSGGVPRSFPVVGEPIETYEGVIEVVVACCYERRRLTPLTSDNFPVFRDYMVGYDEIAEFGWSTSQLQNFFRRRMAG